MRIDSRAFTFRRSYRLPDYDYTHAGAYLVTICCLERACIFGEIANGAMRLNRLGSVVCQQWRRTAEVRPYVELDAFVIMPNHLHGILFLLDRTYRSTAYSIDGTDFGKTHTLRSGSLGAIIGQFKSTVTRQARRLEGIHDVQIWQRNYYEHVIRNEESLNEIRKYMIENPARWAQDSLYVE